MNTLKIATKAIGITLLLSSMKVAVAAIDDQGMAYVSASEGLSGRIQVRLQKNDGSDSQIALETLRLYLSGDLDLGNGLSSTYYAELRNTNSGGGTNAINIFAYDIGLSSPIGKLHIGRLDGVTDRMVPGGSLDQVAGSNAASLTSYPDDNSIRYETPTLGGLQFGLSGKVRGVSGYSSSERPATINPSSPREANAIDGYDIAINYNHPIGLQLGVGVETVEDSSYEISPVTNELLAVFFGTPLFANTRTAAGNFKEFGYRAGMRFNKGDWTIGAEHRSYEGKNLLGEGGQTGAVSYRIHRNLTRPLDPPQIIALNFNHKDVEYIVNRLALLYKFNRFSTSLNYSNETSEGVVTGIVNGNLGPDRTTLGVDLSYALGSKSRIAIGYVQTERTTLSGFTFADLENISNADGSTTVRGTMNSSSSETERMMIDYQVNF